MSLSIGDHCQQKGHTNLVYDDHVPEPTPAERQDDQTRSYAHAIIYSYQEYPVGPTPDDLRRDVLEEGMNVNHEYDHNTLLMLTLMEPQPHPQVDPDLTMNDRWELQKSWFNQLLKLGADPNQKATMDEISPMHIAALHSTTYFFIRLLQHGGDPNIRDNYDRSPLFYASRVENGKCLDFLLRFPPCNKNAHNLAGNNAMVETLNRPCNLRVLVAFGLNVLQRTNSNSKTLIHSAVLQNGTIECMNLLLEAGLDINAVNQDGWTALRLAIRVKRTNFAQKLLDYFNPEIDRVATDGSTALFDAVQFNPSFIQPLIQSGANPNHVNFKGETPLYLAAKYRIRGQFTPELIALGAQDNRRFEGKTLCLVALEHNNWTAFKYLVATGSDMDEKNDHGGVEETIWVWLFETNRWDNVRLVNTFRWIIHNTDDETLIETLTNYATDQILFVKHARSPEERIEMSNMTFERFQQLFHIYDFKANDKEDFLIQCNPFSRVDILRYLILEQGLNINMLIDGRTLFHYYLNNWERAFEYIWTLLLLGADMMVVDSSGDTVFEHLTVEELQQVVNMCFTDDHTLVHQEIFFSLIEGLIQFPKDNLLNQLQMFILEMMEDGDEKVFLLNKFKR